MEADITSNILETLAKSLANSPHPTVIFSVESNVLHLLTTPSLEESINDKKLPQSVAINMETLQKKVVDGVGVISTSQVSDSFPALFDIAKLLGFEDVTLLPVSDGTSAYGLLMVGGEENSLKQEYLQPYQESIELARIAIEYGIASQESNLITQKLSLEIETLDAIVDSIKTPWDITELFSAIHEQIRKAIGDYGLIGALFDEKTASISIPYLMEDGKFRSIETFPLGEGLTSILLRTKQPLLLVENTMEQAKALGAKVDGKPAESWMGTPILVGEQAIGALIVQDLEHEHAFTQEQLEYLTSLSRKIANIIYNARILDENRKQILKIQASAEIARDISSALNLDELLLKAINLIRERFDFYYAAVFLVDPSGIDAVIREATGEAGAHMKRTGHRLAIGSKSIVGFVAKQGEALVINDTSTDATHLPNPMLPETRAEAAIPLKVGDRILGVLDVQSTVPYSFSPNDISTFQVLADQLAIAVNNTELFAETQEHLSQHRLLHHITTSAASGSTLDEALTAAVEGLQVTLGGDRVSILLSDPERNNLIPKAWIGYSEEITDLSIPFGSGITGWVAARRKPLRINDISQDARYIEISANTRSEMAIPLIFRNDILGVLNVESEHPSAYTENDEEMLGTLAGSLAAIIANARLVEQIRKQADRERQLYDITSKIRRSTDIQSILATTIKELSNVTGARRAQISIGAQKEESVASSRTELDTNRKE